MTRVDRSESGSALVELAVVAPFLVLLLVGLIDAGRYTYYGILAAHAARAAVQYGAENLVTAADSTGMKNAATADAQSLSGWQITTTPICMINGALTTCPTSSSLSVSSNMVYYVQVTVTAKFSPLITYPGFPKVGIPVSATTTMRVDTQ
jgi:Flp pilus assembly protein TadG